MNNALVNFPLQTLYEQYKGYKIVERKLQLDMEKGLKGAAIRIEFEQDQPKGWVAALVSGNRQVSCITGCLRYIRIRRNVNYILLNFLPDIPI